MARGERGTSRPYLRGAIWWIRYSVSGEEKERFESTGSKNKQDAVRLLNQRRKENDDRRVSASDATVSDLLDLYLFDQRKQQRSAYKAAESYVRIHLRPAFGKVKASKVTSAMIDRFIEQKRNQPLANGSINRYLSALCRAFTLGLQSVPP